MNSNNLHSQRWYYIACQKRQRPNLIWACASCVGRLFVPGSRSSRSSRNSRSRRSTLVLCGCSTKAKKPSVHEKPYIKGLFND
ncbi:uncharacterized protein ASCRUDRAFT_154139 [Ascoidea rubescens DSM 1968]|uniref:Uncharacterized protein n=1 Tax=Ascoidea rubescens DSM 1968 TaxID=1344418 RepID=A0A1D2VFQ2_9ASCO|nr:hypothetical protein ASCRUDRAFT_154139 [Ascoidea rubescens DSM 1968]ODV60429.1 hypothetical protein ASCRUDRAFT_154139 [Ascoidea rubescens DSM 1968]